MAGVSAAYITNKLAAEGTTVATVNLILQFLNGATSAAAIAGVEPQEGPVVDDPARGFGDRVRDYDIGLTVAQHTLNKRAAVGTFTSLEQLAGIRGFGADKLHDLLFSFSRTVYEISAIQFNYNTSSFTNDALQLRRNFSTAAPSISWLKGVSTRYEDSPVLYSIKETTGQTLAFRAAFRANGVSGAYVRALGGGRLGTVREQFVSFDSAGYSGYQTFPLDNPTFRSQGVNLYNIAWRWQWRERPTDTWRELVVTKHRAYIVLEAPTLPWVQTPGSTSLPWTDALEIACSWAAFATTRDQAAQRVTERYNACGRVSYDTVSGATMYGSASYNLTEMIERLNGGLGLGEKVNCTDSANTVSSLANLLGCDLWQSRMGYGFALNPLIAIGYSKWGVPFNGGFSYHEVAWKGACTANDNVFDGCLKVDGDADPTTAPHTPLLPTNMLFGDCSTVNYRRRLCPPVPAGCAACQPDPGATRRRRPII